LGFFSSPHWLNCECIIHEPTAKDKDGGGPPNRQRFKKPKESKAGSRLKDICYIKF